MSLLRLDDPCVLFPMRRESSHFLRRFRPTQRVPDAPCWASFCGAADRSVLVVETGIGKENALRAVDWILAKPIIDGLEYVPRFVVLAGFAGALVEGLRVGDVICATEVVDPLGGSWHVESDPSELAVRVLTTDRLVTTEADKRQLGQDHAVCAVDMESAYVAERCVSAGLPIAVVRAISDEVATSLSPALGSLLAGGRVSLWRVLLAVARRPMMLPELLRLARDTSVASAKLAVVLEEMLVSPTGNLRNQP